MALRKACHDKVPPYIKHNPMLLKAGDLIFLQEMLNHLTSVGNHLYRAIEYSPEGVNDPRHENACRWKLRQLMYAKIAPILKFSISTNPPSAKDDLISLLKWSKRRSDYYYFIGEKEGEGSVVMSSDKKAIFLVKGLERPLGEDLNKPSYPIQFYATLLPFDDQITFDGTYVMTDKEFTLTEEEKDSRTQELSTLAKTLPLSLTLTKHPRIETTLFRDEYCFDENPETKEEILRVIPQSEIKKNDNWHVDRMTVLKPPIQHNHTNSTDANHGHSHNGKPCGGHGGHGGHGHSHGDHGDHNHDGKTCNHNHGEQHNHNHNHGEQSKHSEQHNHNQHSSSEQGDEMDTVAVPSQQME